MANEEASVLSNSKKRRLDLDFQKCLEQSTDEPPPEILVVKTGAFVGDDRPAMGQRGQPPSAESTEDLRRIPENDLEEKIQRMTVSLQEGICAKLPDKGEKFKASLRRYREEKRRRELRSGTKASNECAGTDNTARSRPGGASAEVRLEASSLQPCIRSQFASLFVQKLESGNVSCSHVADKEPVGVCDDACDEDLNNPVHDDRRKRKNQQDRSTHKGKEKGRSLKEMGKSQSASAEMSSPHQSDLAGNGENHEQEYTCKGLNSDKTNSEEDQAVVLLDEEPGTGGTASTAGARDTTIYFPSREDPECVEIQYRDLECLAPGEYLTSPIMNFYIRDHHSQMTTRPMTTTFLTRTSIRSSRRLYCSRKLTKKLILSSSEDGGEASIYFRRHIYFFLYMKDSIGAWL